MRFVGMEPLPVQRPTVEVVALDAATFDLHNDANLRELTYDPEESTFRLTWSLTTPAWQAPSIPDPAGRRLLGSLALLLRGVRSLRITGDIAATLRQREGLSFVQYSTTNSVLGEIRFNFDPDLDIVAQSTECNLIVVSRNSSALP